MKCINKLQSEESQGGETLKTADKKAYQKQYYETHLEEIKAYRKNYREREKLELIRKLLAKINSLKEI